MRDGVDAVVGEAGFGVLGLEEVLIEGGVSVAEHDEWEVAERGDGGGLGEGGVKVDAFLGAFARRCRSAAGVR